MATPVSDQLTRVRRHPERGSDDRDLVDAVLDAGLVAHLGYVVDGRPVVVPTLYGRAGDHLVLHGSAASRAMRTGTAGFPVCVTVTLVDGLVLARSAFHHSANYRSVVVHGEAVRVTDRDEQVAALRVLTEHVAPGRYDEVRAPSDTELRATAVLRLPLTHAVVKVRDAGVDDDPEDLSLPVWAGVVPLTTVTGTPEPDTDIDPALRAATIVATAGHQQRGAPAAVRAGAHHPPA